MDKKQELINAITQNPERRLVVLYDSENGNSDYAYTLGEIQKVEVTETTTYNDERVYFSDEQEELLETIEEDIYVEKYANKILTDEENAEIERLAKEEIKNYEWEPVIVVYVGS
ncbi:hypothetical protein [Lysinibacillus sp. TE18511]